MRSDARRRLDQGTLSEQQVRAARQRWWRRRLTDTLSFAVEGEGGGRLVEGEGRARRLGMLGCRGCVRGLWTLGFALGVGLWLLGLWGLRLWVPGQLPRGLSGGGC